MLNFAPFHIRSSNGFDITRHDWAFCAAVKDLGNSFCGAQSNGPAPPAPHLLPSPRVAVTRETDGSCIDCCPKKESKDMES